MVATFQNSPNDLQMLSDAPAHHLFCLLPPVPPTQNSLPEVLAVVQVRRMFSSNQSIWLIRQEEAELEKSISKDSESFPCIIGPREEICHVIQAKNWKSLV